VRGCGSNVELETVAVLVIRPRDPFGTTGQASNARAAGLAIP
jgi:hypothetical protein